MGNNNTLLSIFWRNSGEYEGRGTPCREMTYDFQNFYHQFLITPGHVFTYSRVKTFGPRGIYGISGQLQD